MVSVIWMSQSRRSTCMWWGMEGNSNFQNPFKTIATDRFFCSAWKRNTHVSEKKANKRSVVKAKSPEMLVLGFAKFQVLEPLLSAETQNFSLKDGNCRIGWNSYILFPLGTFSELFSRKSFETRSVKSRTGQEAWWMNQSVFYSHIKWAEFTQRENFNIQVK